MNALLQSLQTYFTDLLGIGISPKPWNNSRRLPFFLRERYAFHEAAVANLPCLLLVDEHRDELTPAVLRKHFEQIRPKAGDRDLIYVRDRVTAYNRKRLIEQKIPFVVPGNQMYLPMLAIDFRENFRKIVTPSETFSPATQVVVLYALLRDTVSGTRPIDMARACGYSLMTMSRSFDEIEHAGIGDIVTEGRERRLSFPSGRKTLWEKSVPFLRTPVRRRLHVKLLKGNRPGPLAGLSALAGYSMLAEPQSPVCAVNSAAWKALQEKRQVEIIPCEEPGSVDVEVWSYDPRSFADSEKVDRLSLYLSLRDEKDERIESALGEMLGEMRW